MPLWLLFPSIVAIAVVLLVMGFALAMAVVKDDEDVYDYKARSGRL